MQHTLRFLLQRDPGKDRLDNDILYEGYQTLWPDGQPLSIGFDAFCKHGVRLLGLGRSMAGRRERLIDLSCFHLANREAALTRMPGHRIRRFYIRRSGRQGRLHFLDGTPTTIVLDMDQDEPRVQDWIGLSALGDGESQWFDLAACTVERVEGSSVEFYSADSHPLAAV